MKTPLLLGISLVLGACASSNPDYAGHWNVGFAGASAEHAFTGYDADTDGSRYEHERDNAADLALTLRRHVLNDDPNNPLQMRRGWGDPNNPYNMTAGIADAGYMLRDGAVGAYYVGAQGLLMAVDMIVGVPVGFFGVSYPGVASMWSDDDGSPTTPEEFTTKNF